MEETATKEITKLSDKEYMVVSQSHPFKSKGDLDNLKGDLETLGIANDDETVKIVIKLWRARNKAAKSSARKANTCPHGKRNTRKITQIVHRLGRNT